VSMADIFGFTHFTPSPDTILGDLWTVTLAQIAPILPYLLLLVVLVLRPTGLWGTRQT